MHIQAENLQNVKKMCFSQKASGVNGETSTGNNNMIKGWEWSRVFAKFCGSYRLISLA